jgi:hypothetical protein
MTGQEKFRSRRPQHSYFQNLPVPLLQKYRLLFAVKWGIPGFLIFLAILLIWPF